jgi:DNA-binding beta-propeller fold protein YncE
VNLEEKLRQVMEEKAGELGPPRPLPRGTRARVRGRRLGRVLGVGATVVLAGAVIVLSLRPLVPAPPPPATQALPGQRVYVLEDPGGVHALDVAEDGTSTAWRLSGQADLAISPDGQRLFVVSFDDPEGTKLSVVDATSGEVTAEAPFPPPHGWRSYKLRIYPTLAVSPEGTRVFVEAATSTESRALATFDVRQGAFLPEVASLEGCVGPAILPRAEASVVVVCTFESSSQVRFLEISDTGSLAAEERLELPVSGATLVDAPGDPDPLELGVVAWAALSSDSGTLYAVTREGDVMVVDVGARSLERVVELELPAGLRVSWPGQVAVSGDRLLVGLQPLGFDWLVRSTHLAVVDTSTWGASTIRTRPFWAFAASALGDPWVFTVDWRQGRKGGGELVALNPLAGERRLLFDGFEEEPFAVVAGPPV